MPDSMFDKLGDLLNEAIESGNFFKDSKKAAENISIDNKNQKNSKDSSLNSKQKYTEQQKNKESQFNKYSFVYKSRQHNKKNHDCIVSKNKKLIKYAHPDIQKACTFVGVTDEMSYSQAKSLYHKKLLRFHPDKNSDNEVIKKITREKTLELVKAWKIIEKWYKE